MNANAMDFFHQAAMSWVNWPFTAANLWLEYWQAVQRNAIALWAAPDAKAKTGWPAMPLPMGFPLGLSAALPASWLPRVEVQLAPLGAKGDSVSEAWRLSMRVLMPAFGLAEQPAETFTIDAVIRHEEATSKAAPAADAATSPPPIAHQQLREQGDENQDI